MAEKPTVSAWYAVLPLVGTFSLSLMAGLTLVWPSGQDAMLGWAPGGGGLAGALSRAVAADAGVRVIDIRRPTVLVLRSSEPGLAWRLLASGVIPMAIDPRHSLCGSLLLGPE